MLIDDKRRYELAKNRIRVSRRLAAIGNSTITTPKLRSYLGKCGYEEKHLRGDYVYYDYGAKQEREIAVAGFSRPTYNSTTACIAVLDGNSFEDKYTQEQVQLHRSFGSPVILVCRGNVLQFWHFSNGQALRKEQRKIDELDKFFAKYKDKFSPSRIFRAKTLGRLDKESLQIISISLGRPKIRSYILDKFELRTICNLPERGVFGKAGHPSTVLLGRKVKSNKRISYLRIPQSDLETFKTSYQAKEEGILKDDLYKARYHSFRVPELKDIWQYCSDDLALEKLATVGRGVEYLGKTSLSGNTVTISSSRLRGFSKGFVEYGRDIKITDVPSYGYMNLSKEVIRRPLCGTSKNIPQIVLNRIRVSGDNPWRLKAWIDRRGYPCSHNFLVVRPNDTSLLDFFWALLNSPLVNAFVFCHSIREDNKVETMRSIPVPLLDKTSIEKISSLIKTYFDLDAGETFLLQGSKSDKSRQDILRSIDAEILRLYDLPPRLERQLLDFFAGHQRKGVDFKFDRYFPEGFESWIPLHEYLSDEYQRSTPSFVNEWVEKNRTAEVIEALKTAVEAFED